MIYIGIDPGEHTGLAIWDTSKQAFVQLATVPLHKAMAEVWKWSRASELETVRKGMKVHVIFEDARQRNWFPREKNNSEYRGRLMGAGAAKRDAKIWEEFLSDKETALPWADGIGVTFEMHKPQPGTTKWSAEHFAHLTGYTGRTSEHARDAALLVWGMRTKRAK